MIEPLALPLFQPAAGEGDAAIEARFDLVRPWITFHPFGPFSASRPVADLELDPQLLDDPTLRTVHAIGNGVYRMSDGFLEFTLSLPEQKEWIRTFRGDVPVPVTFRYGPVEPTAPFSGVQFRLRGEPLGELSFPLFKLSVHDAKGYAIDPVGLFHFVQHDPRLRFPGVPTSLEVPLVPAGHQSPHRLEIARPLAAEGGPYLTVAGGSKKLKLHNPDSFDETEYLSFLSGDPIEVTLEGAASPSPRIVIEDASDPAVRTESLANPIEHDGVAKTFVPQAELRPRHEPYDSGEPPAGHGKRDASEPLRYVVGAIDGATSVLPVTIRQDRVDVVRQEYVFHGHEDFQGPGVEALYVPDRGEFRPFPGGRPGRALRQLRRSSNYSDVLHHHEEALRVFQLLERFYADEMQQVLDPNLPHAHPALYAWELRINSGWRNPERNEAVSQVRRSNHQFGCALDLKSSTLDGIAALSALAGPPDDADVRAVVHVALFLAARRFLDELIARNSVDTCRKVEVLLENRGTALLSYELQGGAVALIERSGYAAHVGQSGSDDVRTEAAARLASHVHVAWPASKLENGTLDHDRSARLVLPEVPA
ncbi:MAG: hypothetical protein ACF8XB_12950 [Planctomycetota bacterium JB042]